VTKKTKIILITLTIIISLYIIFFKILNVQNIVLKQIFPQEYSEYVYKYAKEFNVDPTMIFSIIKAESNFNSSVISSSEAIGLMQLLESTAKETAEKIRIWIWVKRNPIQPWN